MEYFSLKAGSHDAVSQNSDAVRPTALNLRNQLEVLVDLAILCHKQTSILVRIVRVHPRLCHRPPRTLPLQTHRCYVQNTTHIHYAYGLFEYLKPHNSTPRFKELHIELHCLQIDDPDHSICRHTLNQAVVCLRFIC